MTAGIIDRFDDIFTRYLDSGFGLLGPEVDHIIILLITLDVILAGLLLWMGKARRQPTAALLSKALSVGPVVILLWNPGLLARILANSYLSLGLPPTLSADNFLHPGQLVQTGIEAGSALLAAAEQLQIASLSDHFVEILVFLIAAAAVLAVFFTLAIRMLLALLTFKVTALAGFVLLPFGLFGRGGDLAERTLGAVVAAVIKVLVLTVIIGLGTVLFSHATHGRVPLLADQALIEILASLAMLMLAMFGGERISRLITDILQRRGTDVVSVIGHQRDAFHSLAAPVGTGAYPADLIGRNAPGIGQRDVATIHRILS